MDKELWKLVNSIYKDSACAKEFVQKCNDYWAGKLHKDKQAFSDQDKTAFNLIKPIVETKLKAVLDAQFTLAVVPKLRSFSELQNIKQQQAVADILNNELANVLKNNDSDLFDEEIMRSALNCGFAVSQIIWSTEKDERGDIEIKIIPSVDLRYDKDAKSIKDSAYIGYDFSLNPAKVKNTYCLNEDGTYNEEKCRKIDNIAKNKFTKTGKYEKTKGVINYKSNVVGSETVGQAFVKESDGICAGKTVDLVCMYFIDDSIYAPSENDSSERKELKIESRAKYPNGRMIIFSTNEDEKLILEDIALPESFRSLGNIDVFNSIVWNGILGVGEIDDLIPTQDRIDGLYNKYRKSLEEDYTTAIMQKDESIALDDFVAHPVVFIKPGAIVPSIITNAGMEKANQALTMIDQLENHAAKMARVNETMIYGARQTGTTSAEQVEMLQESPLADIRGIQRNFKNFKVANGNKIIQLIRANYTVDRLIRLSTGVNNAEYAKIQLNAVSGEKEAVLINEAGQAIETIKMKDDWDFEIEVIAGTEVPRSRKEQANLMNTLVDRGILKIQDLDIVEQYLKTQDIPNYRVLIQLLRNKETAQQEYMKSPEARDWKEIMKNPDIAKVFSQFFATLTGYPEAQQQILEDVGLVPTPGKLDNTPVSEITSKSSASEIAGIVPTQISNQAMAVDFGHEFAVTDQIVGVGKKG